ncbi:hypothetical protein N8T08_003019 [Aspergillus melleus]|uniref:Uncharacterized protein n=1 Tax=Aspergillus melleus TaxID=138277 RepID=A0ACC3B8A6_9EURO|nr:hypothetical protein N8T08_003019 [Aspergillus melleus]
MSHFVNFVNINANVTSSRLQFTMRNGGHTLFTGAVNIDRTITVNMRSINSLVLSNNRKTASVEDSSIFSDLYPQIAHAADMAMILNFAAALPLPVLDSLGFNNVSGMVTKFGGSLPPRLNLVSELVYSFRNANASIYRQLFQIWKDGCHSLAGIEGLQVQYLVQPQPVTNGTNSLGQAAGETEAVIGLVTLSFDNALDEEKALNGLRSIVSSHMAVLQRAGLYIPFKYLNYADKSQDPFSSYGKQSKTFLKGVSRRYDPTGLFQTSIPGSFKLFA